MDERIQQLGFVQEYDVVGLYTISHLIPKAKRCGIYLLEFADGFCYIGQSIDVVRRFLDHRRNYSDIVRINFKPVSKRILTQEETQTIYNAQSLGLRLANRDHVSIVEVESDLDGIISPEQQNEWLENPTLHQDTAFRIVHQQQRDAHHRQFQDFKTRSDHRQIIEALKIYVRRTIPAYRKTEMAFWALSCLPSTNASSWPRLSCCSINTMETFVVGYYKDEPHLLWGFVVVAVSVINDEFPNVDQFFQRYPYLEVEGSGYKAAGADQIRLHMYEAQPRQFLEFVNDPIIQKAARRLNLNAMLKGATVQWRGHCLDLADQVV